MGWCRVAVNNVGWPIVADSGAITGRVRTRREAREEEEAGEEEEKKSDQPVAREGPEGPRRLRPLVPSQFFYRSEVSSVIVTACEPRSRGLRVLCPEPGNENESESAPRAENVKELLLQLVGGTPCVLVDKVMRSRPHSLFTRQMKRTARDRPVDSQDSRAPPRVPADRARR